MKIAKLEELIVYGKQMGTRMLAFELWKKKQSNASNCIEEIENLLKEWR